IKKWHHRQTRTTLFPYTTLFRSLAKPAGPLLQEFLKTMPARMDRTVDFLVDVNQRVSRAVKYLIRMEPGVQSPEMTLELKSGSRSEEHTSELQSRENLVCRFLFE